MKKEYRKYVFIAVCVFLAIICSRYFDNALTLVRVILGAATPLILGCIIAYAVNILMSFYERHYERIFRKRKKVWKWKRPVCMVLAFLSLILLIVFIICMVVPELVDCVALLLNEVPAALMGIYTAINKNENVMEILDMFGAEMNVNAADIKQYLARGVEMVVSGMGNLFGSAVTLLTSVTSVVMTFLVSVIFSIYLLSGKERLCGHFKLLVKTYLPKSYQKIAYVLHTIDGSFHRFIVGQCTEAVILGALCMGGMLVLQLPYAVMIGAFIGFTALIPIAGAYIGGIVGALMILTDSPWKAVLFLVFLVVLQQLEGNLIYPRVVGKSIGLPGIWVLAAVTLGGSLMGISGMLVAVPLASSFYKMIKDNVQKRNEVKQVVDSVKEAEERKDESPSQSPQAD